ncbi:MAG: HD domain-containing protein [Candidatus Eisenbacteria bacterium]|nr:HD domain-containing protein [Candidatus Eisenbacteria bacterium]
MSAADPRPDAPLDAVGPQLLLRLSAVIRTARTHDVSNQAFQRQLHDLLAVIALLHGDEDECVLGAIADYFYLDGRRIKASATLLPVYHGLLGEFERRAVGGIRFLQGLHAAELERFFQLFMAAEDPAIAELLPQTIEEARIEHVVVMPAADLDVDDLTREMTEQRTERGRAKRVFWRAVLGTKKILLRARQSGRPDLRQAKRLVQPVVDSVMRHEYSIVGLTAVKDHDEYTYAHCVNVSILSVGMGQALGLPRQVLADLGVAALLHDIGKLAVPGEVLRKPARLTPEEWHLMQRHPLEGVKMTMRMPGLSMLTLDSMRVCLEHHMNFDRTGYPEIAHDWGQATLSRIVAAGDCFDAITAHRTYHRRPRTAFEALQYLLGPTRVSFDPAVLWAMVRTVGLYPAGSVLVTDTGHVALALSPNPEDPRRPFCRLLTWPDGRAVDAAEADAWSPMPKDVRVVRVLRPEEHELATQDALAA